MFRQKALAKLTSPEQLDEPLKVLFRFSRLSTFTAGTLLGLALVWGIAGSIPERSRGTGVLMVPRSVAALQVRRSGRLTRWLVDVGDHVDTGQAVAVLEMPEVEQEHRQAIVELAELKERNEAEAAGAKRLTERERQAIDKRREALRSRISDLRTRLGSARSWAEAIRVQNTRQLQTQRDRLAASRESADQLKEALAARRGGDQQSGSETTVTGEALRAVRELKDKVELSARELDLSNQELDLQEVQLTEGHRGVQATIAMCEDKLSSLQAQLRELEYAGLELTRADSERELRCQRELSAAAQAVERSRRQLDLNREIRSEHAGRVLELTAAPGERLYSGQRMARIHTDQAGRGLVALSFFQAATGKRPRPGMPAHVSPSTVSQRRYGSIEGQVESVSDYPVTTESVVDHVGVRALARRLTGPRPRIEVVVKLVRDDRTRSGYAWTSRSGPDIHLAGGTVADVWVTVGRRPPIWHLWATVSDWFGLRAASK